jgi:DASS family divalent anion:Na+ symporter
MDGNLCPRDVASRAAPVFFGSGYVALGAWWRLGAIISVINIVIWLGIGGLWRKILGLR